MHILIGVCVIVVLVLAFVGCGKVPAKQAATPPPTVQEVQSAAVVPAPKPHRLTLTKENGESVTLLVEFTGGGIKVVDVELPPGIKKVILDADFSQGALGFKDFTLVPEDGQK